MAKKTARKPASKPSKKPAARKPAKASARKPARKASTAGKPVKTGRGLTPRDLGRDLVDLFNRGQFEEVEKRLWSPKIVSVEGEGVAMAWSGRRAVNAKNSGWMASHTMHGASAEGPYVGASGFAVKFRMDIEAKETGERTMMEEVGVYTVQNGKIVREEFMYGKKEPSTATPTAMPPSRPSHAEPLIPPPPPPVYA
jgi:hypothetical protein